MTINQVFKLCLWVLLTQYGNAQTFTAGVYEHAGVLVNGDTLRETVIKNVAVYQRVIEKAAKQKVDILVFPEGGLMPKPIPRKLGLTIGEEVPDPSKVSWNPCLSESAETPVLRNISCLARKYRMYLVINYFDIQPCLKSVDANCPDDNVYLFNTNIIFNREGKIVARYHKRHLYFELKDAPAKFEYVSFETEYGTVATFICADVLFKGAAEVVERTGSKIVVFPTWWSDDLPYMTGLAVQQGFAIRMNVTLLAPNMHYMSNASTSGSGVYLGEKGAINYTMSEDAVPKLLVTRVPPDVDSSSNRFEQDIPPHSSYTPSHSPLISEMKMTKLERPEDSITSCHNGMCCQLTYSFTQATFNEDYYFVVFNGTTNTRDKYKWCTELSLLTRCEPDQQGNPCRHFRYVSKTKFRKAEISCNFSTNYVFPFFLTSGMGLPSKSKWDYQYSHDSAKIAFDGTIDESPVSFGLHGRCFDRDPPYIN